MSKPAVHRLEGRVGLLALLISVTREGPAKILHKENARRDLTRRANYHGLSLANSLHEGAVLEGPG